MDALLQVFKRSIGPRTPFFQSLSKKPLETIDDLFRKTIMIYSVLDGLSFLEETRRNEIKLDIVNIKRNTTSIPPTSTDTLLSGGRHGDSQLTLPICQEKMNDWLLGVVSRLLSAWFNHVEPRQSFTYFKEDLLINAGSQSVIDEL
ncbi:hypothetical protein CK203_043607 [Vitis vinifera]|uniref:Uncharacterized protein n=1 Tax=Vitis vinifera TaxID=29760 RepID=A0A438HYL3_VITVI|nr:hypothetical protein CK203_043607 [Vitis vinifera]